MLLSLVAFLKIFCFDKIKETYIVDFLLKSQHLNVRIIVWNRNIVVLMKLSIYCIWSLRVNFLPLDVFTLFFLLHLNIFLLEITRLQPVKDTREKQILLWKELILEFCRSQKIFVISLEEDFPLFLNSTIESKVFWSSAIISSFCWCRFIKFVIIGPSVVYSFICLWDFCKFPVPFIDNLHFIITCLFVYNFFQVYSFHAVFFCYLHLANRRTMCLQL